MKQSRKLVLIIAGPILLAAVLCGFLFVPSFISAVFCVRQMMNDAMKPTLSLGDKILIERVSKKFDEKLKRGEIIAFYAPPVVTGTKELPSEWGDILKGSIGPTTPVIVRRIIGLPGETIEVKNEHVFVNAQMLEESSYVQQQANYQLLTLKDIKGQAFGRKILNPYDETPQESEKIVVPQNAYFVLGDNRVDCPDSHVFGFIDSDYVLGRVALKLGAALSPIETPKY